jgi:acyl-CoA thioesterase-2
MSWDYHCLSDLLTLDEQGGGLFSSTLHDINLNNRLFGGQILGQALAAAGRTMGAARIPTVMQLLFLKGGVAPAPVDFQVTALQDGKRFSSRHVRAVQEGNFICDAHVTFQSEPQGIEYSEPAPTDIPDPESLLSLTELKEKHSDMVAAGRFMNQEKPCLRICLIDHEHHLFESNSEPVLKYWIKLRNPLRAPDGALEHYAAIAYLSDYWIAASGVTAHAPLAATKGKLYFSSLNHSIWFHAPVRGDEWLLFVCENMRSASGRSLIRARLYDRQLRHVASVGQECLISTHAG